MAPEAPPPEGRLPTGPTCRVDFSRPLDFAFLGRGVRGFAGDTVASALFAAGVRTFGRSLKYHRPRGLYSIEGESSNTFMAIDGVPNECAETTRLRAEMSVRAQNVRGDPRTDLFGLIDPFDRLMPAGFYYRLFHRPYRLWPLFQNALRRMAGTGVLDPRRDSSPGGPRSERYMNAEVAIVGGGAAGMSAALAAAESGLRVCLFERRPWLGGHLAWRAREFEGEPLHRRAEALAARLRAAENVKVFTSSPVTGVWGENLVTGFTIGSDDDPFQERHWECRAKTVVVAAGCMDRPLVFNHNDRPGVMQAGAAWRLARTYAVRPGRAAVFSVGDDLSLEAALDLAGLGVEVRGVADARAAGRQDPALVAALERRGIPVLPGWAASRAIGRRRVKACELRPLNGDGASRFECDLLVANAGTQPRIGVLATAKARLAYCTRTQHPPARRTAARRVRGRQHDRSPGPEVDRGFGHAGRPSGGGPCGRSGRGSPPRPRRRSGRSARRSRRPPHRNHPPRPGRRMRGSPRAGHRPRRKGVRGPRRGRHLQERQGMRRAGLRRARARQALWRIRPGAGAVPGGRAEPGHDHGRAEGRPDRDGHPHHGEAAACAAQPGHARRAGTRRAQAHAPARRAGRTGRRLPPRGPLSRARYFSDDPACRAEILNVRNNVGILDSSPLGKFRIHGPDALKALQRVYVSDMRKARPGRCKYSAMCNDMGHLVDDGVVVKEGDNDYYFTTSSGRAGVNVEWFRFHTRHDDWNYNLVNLTDVLGSLNIAGPNARKVLERVTAADVSNEALPYMACRRIVVGDGVEARCLRLALSANCRTNCTPRPAVASTCGSC